MELKNLKPYQYYSDLYDRHTIEECRRLESRNPELPKDDDNDLSKEKRSAIMLANNLFMYFTKGERYASKEETIRKWMDRDKERDEIFESAKAPENITCLTCGRLMFVESKHFWMDDKDKDRVLFFYDCPLTHMPRRAFFSDGEEWKSRPNPCPECGAELEHTPEKKVKNKIISTDKCLKCGFSKESEFELSVTKDKIDPHFARDRTRFCLSQEEGEKYVDYKYHMKAAIETMKKIEEKEANKESYEKVAKLKKLKIIEVEQLLSPSLEAQGYIKLHFQAPEIKKDIIVTFSIHDSKDRKEYDSMNDLKKAIKKTLEGTNWKLMSDGVDYRLGMLSGRLRGYEREEDLLELVSDTKTKK